LFHSPAARAETKEIRGRSRLARARSKTCRTWAAKVAEASRLCSDKEQRRDAAATLNQAWWLHGNRRVSPGVVALKTEGKVKARRHRTIRSAGVLMLLMVGVEGVERGRAGPKRQPPAWARRPPGPLGPPTHSKLARNGVTPALYHYFMVKPQKKQNKVKYSWPEKRRMARRKTEMVTNVKC
jgi:hypothetical protein